MSATVPSFCACTLLRKASRAVARKYEAQLAKAGLTATQFAILRELERNPDLPLTRLAEAQVMERTSIYRALQPLIRDGLVALADTDDRRVKTASLTPEGRGKIQEALPHWQQAQTDFLRDYGLDAWPDLVAALNRTIQSNEP